MSLSISTTLFISANRLQHDSDGMCEDWYSSFHLCFNSTGQKLDSWECRAISLKRPGGRNVLNTFIFMFNYETITEHFHMKHF